MDTQIKSNAFREFTEAAETLVNPAMERWMEQGGKIVGFFCSAMPEEIITAAGFLPFRMRANDIIRIVNDYSVDCVVWPAHMGHKDGSASVGIMREICRDLNVSFLSLGIDTFDPRYTTPDEVKNKMSQFFTTMGLG